MPAPADDTPLAVTDQASAIVAATTVVEHARRHLRIFAPALDPGLLDAAYWLAALRRFATRPGDKLVQVLLVDAVSPQRAGAPLIALAQRLPSVVQFRQATDPLDLARVDAFLVNDVGDGVRRPLADRWQGEAWSARPGMSQRLRNDFTLMWERARICSELRKLEL